MRNTQNTIPDIHFNDPVRPKVPTGPENIPTMPLILDLSIPANIPERMFPRKYQEVLAQRPNLNALTPHKDFNVTKLPVPGDVTWEKTPVRFVPKPPVPKAARNSQVTVTEANVVPDWAKNHALPRIVSAPANPSPAPRIRSAPGSVQVAFTPVEDKGPPIWLVYLIGVLCGVALVLGALTVATEQGYIAPLFNPRPVTVIK